MAYIVYVHVQMHSAVSLCWAAYTAADGNVQVCL